MKKIVLKKQKDRKGEKLWWGDLTKNLDKLSASVREEIESKVTIVEKTIVIDGKEYTVPVKVCPALHGTGAMGAPSAGAFNYSKAGSQVKS